MKRKKTMARGLSHSMLLPGVLCTVLLLHGSHVDAAVERAIFTADELQQRIRSSFYLLGYCSSPDSPECSSLASLLESSEALTHDSSVKTALLAFDAAYWQTHLNTSTATHLWFARHMHDDGNKIRMQPISGTEPAAAATPRICNSTAAAAECTPGVSDDPHNTLKAAYDAGPAAAAATPDAQSSPAVAEVARAYAAAECSPDVPFYACPQLPPQVKMDLLMSGLAAAVRQQGAACSAGQPGQSSNSHPAAAVAAEPEATAETVKQEAKTWQLSERTTIIYVVVFWTFMMMLSIFGRIPHRRAADAFLQITALSIAVINKLVVDAYMQMDEGSAVYAWQWVFVVQGSIVLLAKYAADMDV